MLTVDIDTGVKSAPRRKTSYYDVMLVLITMSICLIAAVTGFYACDDSLGCVYAIQVVINNMLFFSLLLTLGLLLNKTSCICSCWNRVFK